MQGPLHSPAAPRGVLCRLAGWDAAWGGTEPAGLALPPHGQAPSCPRPVSPDLTVCLRVGTPPSSLGDRWRALRWGRPRDWHVDSWGYPWPDLWSVRQPLCWAMGSPGPQRTALPQALGSHFHARQTARRDSCAVRLGSAGPAAGDADVTGRGRGLRNAGWHLGHQLRADSRPWASRGSSCSQLPPVSQSGRGGQMCSRPPGPHAALLTAPSCPST